MPTTSSKESSPVPKPRKRVRYSSPLVEEQFVYTPENATPAPDSPVLRRKIHISIKCDPKPDKHSSIYPCYYNSDELESPAESEVQSHQGLADEEVVILDEADDDATIEDDAISEGDTTSEDEEPLLNRLPVGLNLEDVQLECDRANLELRKEMAISTAILVQSLDAEQIKYFLNEVNHGHITRYLDWNKIQLAEEETRVAFEIEDDIRNAYLTGASNYHIEELVQDIDAYTIMEQIYLAAENTRGDIKTLEQATAEEGNKMGRYRDLSHDIRARNIVAGVKVVEEKWKATKPTRYRSVATIRRAFDYLSSLHSPNFPWPCSHAFFEATLDIIRVNEDHCMLVFEEDTDSFLQMLHEAMRDAEKRRMKEWIEARTDQQFFDLMGTGTPSMFKDEIMAAPDASSID